ERGHTDSFVTQKVGNMMKLFTLTLCLLWANGNAAIGQPTTRTLSGRIIDDTTGESLPAVTVTVVGSLLSARSNADGHFVLSDLPPGAVRLKFTCIGYQTHDVTVNTDATDLTILLTA